MKFLKWYTPYFGSLLCDVLHVLCSSLGNDFRIPGYIVFSRIGLQIKAFVIDAVLYMFPLLPGVLKMMQACNISLCCALQVFFVRYPCLTSVLSLRCRLL